MKNFLDGRVTLLAGDCMELLATLPENSVDSVVCDPPYHLTSIVKRFGAPNAAPVKVSEFYDEGGKSKGSSAYKRVSTGFMGKQWDGGDIAFRADVWREVLRVLKPGGHLLAFGGTRTYHRLACAIEDAGFECRDAIMWHYGCLSEDAEILTEHGWKRGVHVCEGERVAAWDAATGAITLQPVERHTLAPYSGNLVRFVNDDTDQLLTPNHRVYHLPRQRRMTAGERVAWYGDQYEVAEASEINRWNGIKLPVAGFQDGSGIGGCDYAALLGWVWTEGGFDKAPSTGVRIYQSESANAEKVAEIDALLGRVLPERKRYDRERTYTYGNTVRQYMETCWFFSGALAASIRDDLPSKRPTWDLLWRMTLAEKRAFLDAAMKGDGCGDDFYQADEASLMWFQALLAMVGQRGKVRMRSAPRDGGSVCITPRDTTELQARHLKQATEAYDGLVWCVKVAGGAFVARRKGKVFITGNSGFPKSHDVSKGIDRANGKHDRDLVPFGEYVREKRKAKGWSLADVDEAMGTNTAASWWEGRKAGVQPPGLEQYRRLKAVLEMDGRFDALIEWLEAEREVTGRALNGVGNTADSLHKRDGFAASREKEFDITAPATEAAKQWQGWGTALKPATEIICLARKPLVGTVAENVLKYGTGAINIDGCRVETLDDLNGGAYSGDLRRRDEYTGADSDANAIALSRLNRGAGEFKQPQGRWPANVCTDGSEEVLAAFPEANSARANGNPTNPWHGTNHTATSYGQGDGTESVDYRDKGSAARFFYTAKADSEDRLGSKHPTVKPLDLMQWLVRLVTPPKGTVLDPFAGTGTTGEAAWREGMRAILIEREPEYQEDIARRMDLATKPTKRAAVAATKNQLDRPEDLPLFKEFS